MEAQERMIEDITCVLLNVISKSCEILSEFITYAKVIVSSNEKEGSVKEIL